ncbi:MAG TPA: hypothetical protein VIX73_04800, partial [Kofleriaceae bacterium]
PGAFAAPSRPRFAEHASTGALAPRRWLTVALVAIALLIASGVVSFVLVSVLRQGAAPGPTPPGAEQRGRH